MCRCSIWILTRCFFSRNALARTKPQVTANLLREMGRSALFLNQKMRILAQNRLRNRIKLYLQMLPRQAPAANSIWTWGGANWPTICV